MNLSRLNWDSDFFGLNIGKLVLSGEDDLLKFNIDVFVNYDMVYIFVNHGYNMPDVGANLVDCRVIYRKSIVCSVESNSNVIIFPENKPSQDLYALALQSGEYSRFRLDDKMPAGSYEKLYRRWIEQSVSKVMANDVLCYYYNGKIVGMVTVVVKDNVGSIGLVAVDSSCRGLGIGSALLESVDSYLFGKGVYVVEVATQLDNTKACSWYEKNGYVVDSMTDIYHWWRK